MNVLILTPDAVGSTLLQRMLTIYMQFHEFDRPVINLHELTNGLEKYYSPEFNQEIVSKKKVETWHYYQTLEEITKLLSSVDHYKTSRLAQYHIVQREDPIQEQIPFYRYLDDNFFIIACQRRNLFEHALSLSLNKITKRLNVYSHNEKMDTFIDLYVNKVTISTQVFLNQLNSYRDYLVWSQRHFNIGSVFCYEEHLKDLEKYILNLPVFSSHKKLVTWKEKFDINVDDWNRCHHIPSDIGNLALSQPEALLRLKHGTEHQKINELISSYQHQALPEWPAVNTVEDFQSLPAEIKTRFNQMQTKSLTNYLPASTVEFYNKNLVAYRQVNSAIDRMKELDIIPTYPPIKKQKLAEKLFMIKNWRECLEIYNQWVNDNPGVCDFLSQEDIDQQINQEDQYWNNFSSRDDSSNLTQSVEQLEYQNGARP